MFTKQMFLENSTRLQVIIMSKLDRLPLSNFVNLNAKEKRQFDQALNEYIKSLPPGEEIQTITQDFNRVCNEEIFPYMKPERFVLPKSTPEELEIEEPDESIRKLYGDKIELG